MSDNLPSAACAVLTRNAQGTILDWISWHLALGFRRIYVIDAGSSDHTKHVIEPLTKDFPISWHAPELSDSLSAEERRDTLSRYALSHMVGEEEWVTVLDADEYLVPDPDLETLLKRGQNAAGIALNWCVYGTGEHRPRPSGHLISTYSHRAEASLPDHGFTRLLVKSSYLTSPDHKEAPENLLIPEERLVTADGSSVKKDDLTPHWDGGKIAHYICPASHNVETFPPLLRKHFDRNEVHDPAPSALLEASRHVYSALSRSLLEAGIHSLRVEAAGSLEAHDAHTETDSDLNLPDEAQRPGFFYKRVRPSRRDQLLLVPQAAPPYGITRAFLLRSENGALLEADPAGSHRPLIVFIQEQHPRLLTFVARDERDFTLGDMPCPHGIVTCVSRRTHRPEIFSLPEETGHGNVLFNVVPLPDVAQPDFLPLPPTDRQRGLSLEGFFVWLETHPEAPPQDIQRTLGILTTEDAEKIRQKHPELAPFLP